MSRHDIKKNYNMPIPILRIKKWITFVYYKINVNS